jgi:glycosyltransferase involved in cell wall biosynthesis
VKISIIVPAYNEESLLGESLRQMDRAAEVLRARDWMVEFIVCDNNSTDDTAAVARDFGAQVVFEPINQIARARNRGSSVATGDWWWFIDADSQPSPELFEAAAKAILSGEVVAVGTTLRFENVDPVFRLVASFWKAWSLVCSHMAGSFIAVDAQAFRSIGGFSTELYVGEELDISMRLKRWARREQSPRRVKVLRGVPLLTSGRKARLYGWWESAGVVWRALWAPRRTMRRREACFFWYDGRREEKRK